MNVCLCGETEKQFLFFFEGYAIVRCVCGQVRTDIPKYRKRTQYYQKDNFSIYIEKEAMFRALFREKIAFIKQFRQNGTLLDIGAGVGLFVSEARKAGFNATGLEPSKGSVRAAKKYFGISLEAQEFSRNAANSKYDIVLLNHVLEHLLRPKEVISNATAVLKRNGLFVIGVPNFGSYLSIVKRGRWQSLIPDQHRWHFTLRTLDQLMLPFGFERIGENWENHDRAMHYWWKKPIYWILDQIAIRTRLAEAMLVVYRKSS